MVKNIFNCFKNFKLDGQESLEDEDFFANKIVFFTYEFCDRLFGGIGGPNKEDFVFIDGNHNVAHQITTNTNNNYYNAQYMAANGLFSNADILNSQFGGVISDYPETNGDPFDLSLFLGSQNKVFVLNCNIYLVI